MDPTDIYYVDSNEISKLTFRALTQFDVRNGKPVLVPDLAEDLGTVSADGLTWTFKLKKGISTTTAPRSGRGLRLRDQAVLRARPVLERPDLPDRLLRGRRHVQGSLGERRHLRRRRDPGQQHAGHPPAYCVR